MKMRKILESTMDSMKLTPTAARFISEQSSSLRSSTIKFPGNYYRYSKPGYRRKDYRINFQGIKKQGQYGGRLNGLYTITDLIS